MNSNVTSEERVTFDDEIDLKELINVLWQSKVLIILITTFFAISSVFYALSLTNIYQSEGVFHIPAQSETGAAVSGLGGMAALAGLNLSSGGLAKSAIAIRTIESRAFLKHLITFEDVLPSLMAAKSYDSVSKKIQFDEEIYDENTGIWVRETRNNEISKPSYLEAHSAYMKMITIREDKITGLVTISVEHMSPVFAKELLSLMIKEANELLRNKDLQESSDAIAFLTSEIPKSSLITMKDAINQLVQSKLETQMMAKISNEYVLKVIEPPFIPEKRFKPSRSMICIFGTILGGMLSIFFVLIRYFLFNDIKSNSNTELV